jgi:hypothetical protein
VGGIDMKITCAIAAIPLTLVATMGLSMWLGAPDDPLSKAEITLLGFLAYVPLYGVVYLFFRLFKRKRG